MVDVADSPEPVRELRGWEWSGRLVSAGVQRLEFDEPVTREEVDALLDDILARLSVSAAQHDSPEMRQLRPSRIRMGAVGVRGEMVCASCAATMRYCL